MARRILRRRRSSPKRKRILRLLGEARTLDSRMVGNGSWPETLVLYRTGPAVSVPRDSESPAGRVRYSCLKEAARGEAFMQIQWCWVYEKGCGKREWSEQEVCAWPAERGLEMVSIAIYYPRRLRLCWALTFVSRSVSRCAISVAVPGDFRRSGVGTFGSGLISSGRA